MKLKFNVTGMTCAACSARVEKVTSAVPGVTEAQVNLLAGTMVAEVDGEAGRITVRRAVRLGRKRGGDQVILPETEDVWRLPEMTLSVKPRRKRNDDGADARGEEKT